MIQTYVEHIERTKMQQAGSNSQSEGPGCGRTWVLSCVDVCIWAFMFVGIHDINFSYCLVADVLCFILNMSSFFDVLTCSSCWHWRLLSAMMGDWYLRVRGVYKETQHPLWPSWEIWKTKRSFGSFDILQCSAEDAEDGNEVRHEERDIWCSFCSWTTDLSPPATRSLLPQHV